MDDNIKIRSLQSESEIDSWTIFCERAFAEKVNPPSAAYFARHFFNDPYRDYSLIFIAINNETDEIVSALRLFRRQIYVKSSISMAVSAMSTMETQNMFVDVVPVDQDYSTSCGAFDSSILAQKPEGQDNSRDSKLVDIVGMGEVCTHSKYRRKGLSSALLKHALNVARVRGYQYAFLHAADWIRPLYEKYGFRSLPMNWIKATISIVNIHEKLQTLELHSNDDVKFSCDTLDFARHANTLAPQLQTQNSSWQGCLVRDASYIAKWIKGESHNCSMCYSHDIDHTMIYGYVTLQHRGSGVLRLHDAFVHDETLFWKLLFLGIGNAIGKFNLSEEMVAVLIPQEYLNSFPSIEFNEDRTGMIASTANHSLEIHIEERRDDGWMVSTIGTPIETSDISKIDIIWSIDSF